MSRNLLSMNNPHRSLEGEILFIKSLGFDGVELTAEPPCSDISDIKVVSLELLEHCRVGHTRGDLFFAASDKKTRLEAVETFNRYLDFFKEIGINLVNIHPHVPEGDLDSLSVRARNIECFAEVVRYATSIGSEVMIENQPPFNSSSDFARLFAEVPNATLLLDIAHAAYLVNQDEPSAFMREHRSRIRHVHLSDNDGFDDDHFCLGHGALNLDSYATLLRGLESPGVCLSLEAFRVRENGEWRMVTQGEREILTKESLCRMRRLVSTTSTD